MYSKLLHGRVCSAVAEGRERGEVAALYYENL